MKMIKSTQTILQPTLPIAWLFALLIIVGSLTFMSANSILYLIFCTHQQSQGEESPPPNPDPFLIIYPVDGLISC